jgi:hypothetical protein
MKRFVLGASCSVFTNDLDLLGGSGRLRIPKLEILKGRLAVVEEGKER